MPAKVVAVSRAMSAVCAVLAFGGPLVIALFLSLTAQDDAAWHDLLVDVAGGRLQLQVPAPLWSRLAVSAVVMASVGLAGYGFWQLRGFFRCVAAGAALSLPAAARLSNFARTVALLAFARPVISALASVLATLPNPPGARQLIVRVGSDDVIALVIGVLLVVVAWTLREGARIAREHAEFI